MRVSNQRQASFVDYQKYLGHYVSRLLFYCIVPQPKRNTEIFANFCLVELKSL